MTDYTDQRDAIVARLETITNIGQVYGRQRWAADWSKYLDLFKFQPTNSDPVIRGWIVSPESIDPIEPDRFGATRELWNWVIRGYQAFSDASDTEGTHLDLALLVLRNLNARIDLGSTSVVDYGVGPPSMRVFDPVRQFGSVLCSYVEITLPIELQKSVSFQTG